MGKFWDDVREASERKQADGTAQEPDAIDQWIMGLALHLLPIIVLLIVLAGLGVAMRMLWAAWAWSAAVR